MKRRTGLNLSALVTMVAAVAIGLQAPVSTARAAAPLTDAQAIASQTGAVGPVRGYVVGQPTATATVVRPNFPSDHALALADSAGETGTTRMIYVQITSAFRPGSG